MPDWRAEIRDRLTRLGLDPTREAAIVEELVAHLEQRLEELRVRGMSGPEAEAAVRAEHLNDDALSEALAAIEPPARPAGPVFGNERPARFLLGLTSDIRYAARSLLKSPGLTLVALLTLAIGIGANASIFSVVNAVLLRPPPFAKPEQLVTFWGTAPEKGLPVVNYPEGLYDYYRKRLHGLDPMAMYSTAGFTLTRSGEPERLDGAVVSHDFFRVLGIQPHLGRFFLPDEHAEGRNTVTVLSYGLWQRRFGGDPGLVGRSLMFNDLATTVVGVMPPGFNFPDRTQLWTPLTIDPASLNCWCYDAIGRLAGGRNPEAVAEEIDLLNADFWSEREGRPRPQPGTRPRSGTVVQPLATQLVGEVRTPVLVLLGAVGMVLLIACANLANLLLARATARGREIAVRSALGASPRRIARQLLAESLLLSVGGAGLGLLVALGGLRFLSRAALERVSYLERISLDPIVLAYAVGLGVLTGVLFGFAPALRSARLDLAGSLKEGSRASGDRSNRTLNDVFVITQLATSLILLVGSGLLLRSFARLMAVDPGFRAANVVVGRVSVPWTVYREGPELRRIIERLADLGQSVPGVEAFGLSSTAPFSSGNNQSEMLVQGQEPGPDQPIPVASIRRVSPGYFDAVGTRIIEGRGFTATDRDSSEQVAIIDESVARRYWPNGGALGMRIATGGGGNPTWRTIVGVVVSIRHRQLDRPPDHYVYYPLSQQQSWTLDLVARSSASTTAAVQGLQAGLRAADPNLPLYDVHTLEDALDRSVATRKLTNLLLLGFAASAVLLAAIGIYGVMARAVTARVREFGVRLALGAQAVQIERLVLRQGMRLVLIGAALGTAGAMGVTRLLKGLLFQVNPLDPITFGAAVLLLGGVALAACWVPARRATNADPLEALRAE